MLELQERLCYSFSDTELLATALTHSSYANENRAEGRQSNERLEFLGDSVLGYVVADHLYRHCPDLPEGRMTRLRAELVCEQTLLAVAQELELGRWLMLGKGEENTGGRERPSILADCVEALIAAMYLDGGLDVPRRFIRRHILCRMDRTEPRPADYKTRLQEVVQRETGHILTYAVVSESGPDHDKRFTVRAALDGSSLGEGTGHSKKEAEQLSAMHALEALGYES